MSRWGLGIVGVAAACHGGGGGSTSRVGGAFTAELEGDGLALRGGFASRPAPLPAAGVDLVDGFPDLGDGDCARYDVPWTDFGDAVGVDGGTLEVALAGGRSVSMEPDDFLGDIYYAESLSSTDYRPGTWTISGGGGRVRRFSGDLTAPEALEGVGDLSAVPTSGPAPVSWTPGGGDPVYAELTRLTGADALPVFRWVCRFDDDGAAEIPAEATADFGPAPGPYDQDTVRLVRVGAGVVRVPGVSGDLFWSITSAASGSFAPR